MAVMIGNVVSDVTLTDSDALLSPQVLERIAAHVMARLQERQRHEKAVRDEQQMRPSMTSREIPSWE
jgi:hypothetical protein